MNRFIITASAIALTAMAAPVSAASLLDDFTTFQAVEDTATLPAVNTSTLADAGVIGGFRTLTAATTAIGSGSDGATEFVSNRFGAEQLSFSNAQGVLGTGTLRYDSNGAGLDDGIGGAGYDLTNGGAFTKFFFEVTDFDQLNAADFSAQVCDVLANCGTYTESLTVGFNPFLSFGNLAFTSAGVNFGAVDSLTFSLTSTSTSFDGSLGSISVVPLPASALLLLGGLGGFAGVSAAAKRRRRKA